MLCSVPVSCEISILCSNFTRVSTEILQQELPFLTWPTFFFRLTITLCGSVGEFDPETFVKEETVYYTQHV